MREIPEAFAAAITRDLGSEAEGLLKALREGEPRPAVRYNPAKMSEVPDDDGPVKWWPDYGRYVSREEPFTLDPLFHAGCYYVQDASSMFVAHALRQVIDSDRPLVVLDACAAPGGKTTAAIDALPAGSLVIANEIVPARCAVLKENILKWGCPSTIVTRTDTAALSRLGEVADVVIADVPCSGEGMMRKEAVAASQWSEGLVDSCAERQREIVGNLWEILRPGGIMIYSTCTFNRREDEEMVSHIIENLGGESVEIPVEAEWGIAPRVNTPYHCYRFMPHRLQGEGLFVAVIRKNGESAPSASAPKPKKDRKKKGTPAVDEAVKSWISTTEPMEFTVDGDRVSAFPARWADLLRRVSDVAPVIHHGIPLATVKGRDLIPAHALAMSTALNPDAFPRVELSLDAALDYLRREPVELPAGTPRGFVTVTFGSRPLGFVKNLGNRSNNLYPPEYKIKFLL